MRLSYSRYSVKERRPYRQFLAERHEIWSEAGDARARFAGRSRPPGYALWEERQGLRYLGRSLPGYAVRGFKGRYQLGYAPGAFFPRKFAALL